MPLIQVTMYPGRTAEQKQKMVEALAQALVDTVNVSTEAVEVIIQEVERSNWAFQGKLKS